jgi:type IV pilus assembly protein PilM
VSLTDSGRKPIVSAYASEVLPPGAVEANLNSTNVHDQATLAAAVKRVLDLVGARASRVALVLPDTVAKLSLIRFEKVPQKVQDLDQLIRWQVRKSAPFRIEDAQVSWHPGMTPAGGGREFIVTVARRDIIEAYERACEAAGAYAGIVDIATPNVMNAVLAAAEVPSEADWLLVHIAADYATLVVVRGQDLVFFRNRTASEVGDLADLVHQTVMYHEDRLGGGGFRGVILAGAASRGNEPFERLRRTIEERIGTRVEPLDFRGAAEIRDRIKAGPDLLDALAPAVGVLLRERVAPRTNARAGRVA